MTTDPRRRLACSCGWTYREPPAQPRPDTLGLSRFYRDMGLAAVSAGHQLLDAFQPGRHKVQVVRDVTVTLELDTSRFDAAITRASRSSEDLSWSLTKRTERKRAYRFLDDLMVHAWSRYGWERPS